MLKLLIGLCQINFVRSSELRGLYVNMVTVGLGSFHFVVKTVIARWWVHLDVLTTGDVLTDLFTPR